MKQSLIYWIEAHFPTKPTGCTLLSDKGYHLLKEFCYLFKLIYSCCVCAHFQRLEFLSGMWLLLRHNAMWMPFSRLGKHLQKWTNASKQHNLSLQSAKFKRNFPKYPLRF